MSYSTENQTVSNSSRESSNSTIAREKTISDWRKTWEGVGKSLGKTFVQEMIKKAIEEALGWVITNLPKVIEKGFEIIAEN